MSNREERHQRIDDLKELEGGWLGNTGNMISVSSTQYAHQLVDGIFNDSLSKEFGIFPREDGGISFEWFSTGKGIFAECNILPDSSFELWTDDEELLYAQYDEMYENLKTIVN